MPTATKANESLEDVLGELRAMGRQAKALASMARENPGTEPFYPPLGWLGTCIDLTVERIEDGRKR